MNPDNGGVYEHKLATMMGYPNELRSERGGTNPYPSPMFIEAAKILEDRGYARRLVRQKDYPIMGLQHTRTGLERAEYLKSRLPYRAVQFKSNASKKTRNFFSENKKHIQYGLIFALIFAVIIEILKLYGFEHLLKTLKSSFLYTSKIFHLLEK